MGGNLVLRSNFPNHPPALVTDLDGQPNICGEGIDGRFHSGNVVVSAEHDPIVSHQLPIGNTVGEDVLDVFAAVNMDELAHLAVASEKSSSDQRRQWDGSDPVTQAEVADIGEKLEVHGGVAVCEPEGGISSVDVAVGDGRIIGASIGPVLSAAEPCIDAHHAAVQLVAPNGGGKVGRSTSCPCSDLDDQIGLGFPDDRGIGLMPTSHQGLELEAVGDEVEPIVRVSGVENITKLSECEGVHTNAILPEETPYMYVIVRRDIPLGDQMVQIGHACQESGARFGCPDGCHMVLGSAENEVELLKWERKLSLEDVNYHMFFEPDDGMGYTAIATQPLRGSQRQPLKRLRIYQP